MRWFWRQSETLGQRGERLAAHALKRAGYRILERNAELGRYEVDLIAREGDTIAFVEVKTRIEADHHAPEDNITPAKQSHIVRAARIYMARHPDPAAYYRFDVVTVVIPPKGRPKIVIYRDAFRA